MDRDLLALDAETMRALGREVVDMLVDLVADPSSTPALRTAAPAEMQSRLACSAPQAGEGFDAILEQLRRDVLPFASNCQHPGYFAYIPASGTWPAALADLIASALNIYVGSWLEAAGPSQVELTVLDWFRSWLGLHETAAGVLVSGGSAANLTALACAREALAGPMADDLVLYVGDQAHSSLGRAARVLGFRPDQVRVLPSDAGYRLRLDALAAAIDADVQAGRRPLAAVATAGTTNTGAVDDLQAMASLCARHGVWLHVDAAYGGFAVLSDRGRALLRGIERADSITLDPHKFLYQPFECGCLLVREGRLLRHAFEETPDYLADSAADAGAVNFSDLGVQLTRGFRALKVWMSLRLFGVDAFARTIERCLQLARHAQRLIERDPDLELLSPAALGIVCFRRRVAGVDDEDELERLNAAAVATLARSGRGLVSSTRLRGRYAMRICILNHTSTAADVEQALEVLARAPLEDGPPRAEARYDRHGRMGGSPLGGARGVAPELLDGVPFLRGLSPESRARAASTARLLEPAAGQAVVEEWHGGRDFHVVLAGRLEILRGGVLLDTIGPGDFFGEVAALDWGAGFGYARLATVRAVEPARLLALPPDELGRLMVELPDLRALVRQTAGTRMGRL